MPAQIQKHDTEVHRGAMIRFRVARFTDEEPTKSALWDEKRYALSKHILQIESRGSICPETCQIRAAFEEYYKNPFTAAELRDDYEEKADHLIALVPPLQEDDRLSVDGPITREEIKEEIR